MSKIDTTIVGFLDVLGYKKLVERHMADLGIIRDIEKIIKKSTNLLKNLNATPMPSEYQQYRNRIIDLCGVRVLSDSIVFTLPVSDINQYDGVTENDNIANHLYFYFEWISMFCMFFIANTGHVIRGGISIGSHYESDEDRHLFIFSQAWIDAVKLEENAYYPRVIVHNKLKEYIDGKDFCHRDKFFYDDDDAMCFNLYDFIESDKLNSEEEEKNKRVLLDIKRGLELNIKDNIKNKDEMCKLRYFAKFHNEKISQMGSNFNGCIINII